MGLALIIKYGSGVYSGRPNTVEPGLSLLLNAGVICILGQESILCFLGASNNHRGQPVPEAVYTQSWERQQDRVWDTHMRAWGTHKRVWGTHMRVWGYTREHRVHT